MPKQYVVFDFTNQEVQEDGDLVSFNVTSAVEASQYEGAGNLQKGEMLGTMTVAVNRESGKVLIGLVLETLYHEDALEAMIVWGNQLNLNQDRISRVSMGVLEEGGHVAIFGQSALYLLDFKFEVELRFFDRLVFASMINTWTEGMHILQASGIPDKMIQ